IPVRSALLIAAAVAALTASPAHAGRRSGERASAHGVRRVVAAGDAAWQRWQALTGRVTFAIRRVPELHRGLEVNAGLDRALSLVSPGFRLPFDVAPTPALIARPARGELSSPFGVRRDPIRTRRRKLHRGLD